MFIIADKRIPLEAKSRLNKYGKVLFFESTGATYKVISGHPDIFCCTTKNELVVAPNMPAKILQKLNSYKISLLNGKNNVGDKYPQSAHYNALVTDKYLIHNLKHTDPVLLESCLHLVRLDVKQAYTQCNVLALNNDTFIASDRGIEKTLQQKGLEVLFVNPKGILLPGVEHGFFGGCCGIFENKIFFIGSLNHFPDGEKVRQFLPDYEIIELYDGPLFDGGSLIFIE